MCGFDSHRRLCLPTASRHGLYIGANDGLELSHDFSPNWDDAVPDDQASNPDIIHLPRGREQVYGIFFWRLPRLLFMLAIVIGSHPDQFAL